jgi:hypothetical protein
LLRIIPYFTPVLLAELRVAHPMSALESPTVSATGPLLIASALDEPYWLEAALLSELEPEPV